MSDDIFNELETFKRELDNKEQPKKPAAVVKKPEFTYDMDDGALQDIISGKKPEEPKKQERVIPQASS